MIKITMSRLSNFLFEGVVGENFPTEGRATPLPRK